MLTIRHSQERGSASHGWLDTRHTFSFADYYDPNHMGFRTLRVLNEDRVAPGAGFPTHGHRDMEILTYVVDGALEHRDSLGTGSVVRPGELQRMSAGRGVHHSEYNHSQTDPLHFLQIWIQPSRRGIDPSYEQKRYDAERARRGWTLIASPDGRDDSVLVHQDVSLYVTLLAAEKELTFTREAGRHLWLHVVRGGVSVGGEALRAGDALYSSDESELLVRGTEDAELLLFDLA